MYMVHMWIINLWPILFRGHEYDKHLSLISVIGASYINKIFTLYAHLCSSLCRFIWLNGGNLNWITLYNIHSSVMSVGLHVHTVSVKPSGSKICIYVCNCIHAQCAYVNRTFCHMYIRDTSSTSPIRVKVQSFPSYPPSVYICYILL